MPCWCDWRSIELFSPSPSRVQGLSGVADDWRGFDAALSGRCKSSPDGRRPVLALDNRGMGGSRGGTSSPFSVRAMATDALSVTAAVFGRRSRVHLLGVSMGGMIAQTMCHLVLSSRAQHTARHRGDHHSQHGKTSEHGRADRRDDDDGHHAAAVVPPVSIASAVFGCTMRGGNTDRLSLLSSSSEFFKIMATPPVFPHGATATSTWLPPLPSQLVSSVGVAQGTARQLVEGDSGGSWGLMGPLFTLRQLMPRHTNGVPVAGIGSWPSRWLAAVEPAWSYAALSIPFVCSRSLCHSRPANQARLRRQDHVP